MAVVELVIKMLLVKRGSPALHEPTVEALMQSMAEVGLVNPITVWRPTGVMPVVIAGRHRLEAARRLGWEDISCNVLEQLKEEPTAETIEVVENLHRRDIPKAEKDRLIRRYVELVEQKKADGISAPAEPKIGRGRPSGSATAVATHLGMNKSAVNKAIARDKAREAGEPIKAPTSSRARLKALATATARSLDDNEDGWQRRLKSRLRSAPNTDARSALEIAARLTPADRTWLRTQLS